METKNRLLFVDDDANVLRGLKRMLRPYSKEWEVEIASSGAEALKMLEESHYDCVVSDMRMPQMNGAELLSQVFEKHPHVARFVLSGHADSQPILQAIPVTHQYFSKPCTPEQLTNAVKRALALHSYIKDDALKTVIGQVDSLPSRPQVFAELTRALTDENTSLEDVGKIVETDVAISAKLLQVVNSAFFGLPQNMTKVKDAASYLGVNMLKSIVLSEEMYRSFKTDQAIPGFSLDEEYEKSFLCAQVAKKMVTSKEDTENAFMAGVLHRTGRLVLAKYLPDKLTQVLSEYNSSDKSLAEIEKAIVGASNEYVGAYLLGLWGLPYSVVEAVAHHNHPWVVEHSDFQILDAVYVASHLVAGVRNQSKDAELNMDYLQKIGVAKNLDQWRQLAEEIMGSVSDGKEG